MLINNKIVKYFGLFLILMSVGLIIYSISAPFRIMMYRESVNLSSIPGDFHGSRADYIWNGIFREWGYHLIYFLFGLLPGLFYFKKGFNASRISKILAFSLFAEWIAAIIAIVGIVATVLGGGDWSFMIFTLVAGPIALIFYGVGVLLLVAFLVKNFLTKKDKL